MELLQNRWIIWGAMAPFADKVLYDRIRINFRKTYLHHEHMAVKGGGNRTAHTFGQAFRNGKPQSGGRLCPGGISFVKPVEYLPYINVFRMEHVIGAAETDPAADGEQFQTDMGPSVDQGVFDQILQCTAHSLLVAPDEEAAVTETGFGLDTFFEKFLIEGKEGVINTLSEIHRFRLKRVVFILEPGIGKKLFQHISKASDTGLYDGDITPTLFFGIALQEELEITVHGS